MKCWFISVINIYFLSTTFYHKYYVLPLHKFNYFFIIAELRRHNNNQDTSSFIDLATFPISLCLSC